MVSYAKSPHVFLFLSCVMPTRDFAAEVQLQDILTAHGLSGNGLNSK